MIKVADFGLSENMDISKDYFRQTEDSISKLPLRWLALESITDHKFSEKTDVVCIPIVLSLDYNVSAHIAV